MSVNGSFLEIEIARLSEIGKALGMDALVREIEQALKKPGKSKQGLARALGREPPAVTGILKGTRQIKAKEIPVIRQYLELDTVVPIVGYVGASSEEVFFENADNPAETAPAPTNSSPETVAVEIRGDSLGASLNGWLAYYDEQREPITPDLLGRLCVVGLTDGRVLIKTPRQARQKGRYHLFPNGVGEVIPDVQIRWAARVKSMAPR